MSYHEETRHYIKCNECGNKTTEHPEADGSVGLPVGETWSTYDPDYFGVLLRPAYRVDFCSDVCKNAWFDTQFARVKQLMERQRHIYKFNRWIGG